MKMYVITVRMYMYMISLYIYIYYIFYLYVYILLPRPLRRSSYIIPVIHAIIYTYICNYMFMLPILGAAGSQEEVQRRRLAGGGEAGLPLGIINI